MNLTTVKSTSEMVLKGIKTEAEWRDNELAAITLTDADGKVLRIAKHNYGEMKAFVPAPPKTRKVTVLTGHVRGLGDATLVERFDDECEAISRRYAMESSGAFERVESATEDVEIPF